MTIGWGVRTKLWTPDMCRNVVVTSSLLTRHTLPTAYTGVGRYIDFGCQGPAKPGAAMFVAMSVARENMATHA